MPHWVLIFPHHHLVVVEWERKNRLGPLIPITHIFCLQRVLCSLWKSLRWIQFNQYQPPNFLGTLVGARAGTQRRQWHPTPVLLPGKSHGQRSLVGCSPWGREESDTTERLHFHFSLLCIGEGNGNPLQCSCLENPRDGVAQSQTGLKWLSSSRVGTNDA